jgi:hypothetical protein
MMPRRLTLQALLVEFPMSIELKEVIDFAEKIEHELETKKSWKRQDIWWSLGQLVKELRLLDGKLSANANADISDKAVIIATYALIIAYNQKNKSKKKKVKKANVKRLL